MKEFMSKLIQCMVRFDSFGGPSNYGGALIR